MAKFDLWRFLARIRVCMTLDEATKMYLAQLVERGCASRTLVSYGQELALFRRVLAGAGVTSADAVTRDHVIAYLARPTPRGNALAVGTRNRKATVLDGMFDCLVKSGDLHASPTHGVPWLKETRRESPTLTAGDVRRLAAQARTTPVSWAGTRDAAIVTLLFHSGVRVAELVSLDIGQVRLRERLLIAVHRKGGHEQPLPLNSIAAQALSQWLATRETLDLKTNALFVSRLKARLSSRSVESRLAALGRQAGFAFSLHPHLLRHSFATALLAAGANLEEVRRLLGHANVATTSRYAHPDQASLRGVVDRLARPPRAAKQGD